MRLRDRIHAFASLLTACGGTSGGADDLFGDGSASASGSTEISAGADVDGSVTAPETGGSGPSSGQDSSPTTEGDLKLDVGAGDTGPPSCHEGMKCSGCTAVDLLFVIDNSHSMSPHQEKLALAFPSFADAIIAALPPGTSLHVGVTSTEMGFVGNATNCSCEGFAPPPNMLLQCGDASLFPAEDFYVTPDIENTGTNGAQGRLYEANGLAYFDIDTDAPEVEVQMLRDWFAATAIVGEEGSNIEMASAAVGWATDPANDETNAGFLRDEGAVLVLFFLSDEPDQTDAPGLTMAQTGQAMLDKIAGAKAGCGGLECVVGGGFVEESCLPENALGALLDGLGAPPVLDTLPVGDYDPSAFLPLLSDTLTQVIAQTCDEIEPQG